MAEFVPVRWNVPSMGATTMQVSARTGPNCSITFTSSGHAALTSSEVQNHISMSFRTFFFPLRNEAI